MKRRLPQVCADYRTRQNRALVWNCLCMSAMPAYAVYLAIAIPANGLLPAAFFLVYAMLIGWAWFPSLAYHLFYLAVNEDIWHGNYSRADAACVAALSLYKRIPLMNERYLTSMTQFLAYLRIRQGFFDSAESLYRQVIAQCMKLPVAYRAREMADLNYCLGLVCSKQSKFLEAEICLAQSIEEFAGEQYHRWYQARSITAFGWLHLYKGELEESLKYLNQANKLFESTPVPKDPFFPSFAQTSCFLGLALAYARQKDLTNSKNYLGRFLGCGFAGNSVTDLHVLNLVIDEYLMNGCYEQCEQLLEMAYSIGYYVPFHEESKQTVNLYEKLLIACERGPEIAEMRSWLRSVPLLTA